MRFSKFLKLGTKRTAQYMRGKRRAFRIASSNKTSRQFRSKV